MERDKGRLCWQFEDGCTVPLTELSSEDWIYIVFGLPHRHRTGNDDVRKDEKR